MAIMSYLVDVYALLVKTGKRSIDTIPASYQVAVAEKLANEN